MKKRDYRMEFRLFITLFLLLSGCANVYTPGISELTGLCKLDGGDRIYKTVYADGYFDASKRIGRAELIIFIQSGYEYIEHQEIDKEETYFSDMKKPVIWHIYKSNRSDPNCNTQIERQFDKITNPRMQFIEDFFSSSCLAVKKMDKPKSRYWYRYYSSSRYLDDGQRIKLVEQYSTIEDYYEGSLLAERKMYLLYPYRKKSLHYGFNIGCENFGVSHEPYPLNEIVLIPKK